VAGSRHCYVHAPELAETRREAARRGGRARSNQARAAALVPATMTLDELGGWLSALLKSVMAGKTPPAIGTACAVLAKTIVTIRAEAEVEQRLSELEHITHGRQVR
jgi:hypothetical protein